MISLLLGRLQEGGIPLDRQELLPAPKPHSSQVTAKVSDRLRRSLPVTSRGPAVSAPRNTQAAGALGSSMERERERTRGQACPSKSKQGQRSVYPAPPGCHTPWVATLAGACPLRACQLTRYHTSLPLAGKALASRGSARTASIVSLPVQSGARRVGSARHDAIGEVCMRGRSVDVSSLPC